MDIVVNGRRVAVDMHVEGRLTPALRAAGATFTGDASYFDRVARTALAATRSDTDKLVLKRIGLYPGRPERMAVFDYGLDRDARFVLAVAFNKAGEIVAIDTEI